MSLGPKVIHKLNKLVNQHGFHRMIHMEKSKIPPMKRILLLLTVLVILISWIFSLRAQHVNRAWVTLLTNDDYLPGVLALGTSIQILKSKYPLVVMVPSTLSINTTSILHQNGLILRKIDSIYPSSGVKTSYAFSQFTELWSKLRAWELIEYDESTFLDADMLVIKNMDHIFEFLIDGFDIAASFACICNPRRFKHYPAHWIPQNCVYTECDHRPSPWCKDHQHFHDVTMPSNSHSHYFNSGMFVYRPNMARAKDLIDHFNSLEDLTQFTFADQDFLNQFYVGKWKPLPYVFNALKTLSVAHPKMWNITEIYNLHFIIEKPWKVNMKKIDKSDPYLPLYNLWWNMYEQRISN